MARAAAIAAAVFGLALGVSLAIDRIWPKARAEPVALVAAGVALLAAGSPPREESAATVPRSEAISAPPQQRAS
jgi:hypothetical protein